MQFLLRVSKQTRQNTSLVLNTSCYPFHFGGTPGLHREKENCRPFARGHMICTDTIGVFAGEKKKVFWKWEMNFNVVRLVLLLYAAFLMFLGLVLDIPFAFNSWSFIVFWTGLGPSSRLYWPCVCHYVCATCAANCFHEPHRRLRHMRLLSAMFLSESQFYRFTLPVNWWTSFGHVTEGLFPGRTGFQGLFFSMLGFVIFIFHKRFGSPLLGNNYPILEAPWV